MVDERHAHEARGKRWAQRFGCVAGLAPQEVGRGGVGGGRREERAVEGHAPLVGAALVALVLNLEICHARLDVCACADLLAREAAVVVQVVHIPLRRVVIERGVAAGAAVVYDLDIILVCRQLQQLHAPALVHKVLRVDTVHQTHGRYAVEVECRHAPPYGKVVELLEVHDNGDFTTSQMCRNGMSLTPLRTCGLSWGRVRLCGIVSVLVGLGQVRSGRLPMAGGPLPCPRRGITPRICIRISLRCRACRREGSCTACTWCRRRCTRTCVCAPACCGRCRQPP